MSGFVVGVDLGGTQIRATLTDDQGTMLKRVSTLTLAHVRAIIAERAMTEEQRHTPIVPAALGDDVGLLGAVALVLAGAEAA